MRTFPSFWSKVISDSQIDIQHRAFLSLTKPLGLLQGNGVTNLLVAAPNAFAKDVLETRLRSVCEVMCYRESWASERILPSRSMKRWSSQVLPRQK